MTICYLLYFVNAIYKDLLVTNIYFQISHTANSELAFISYII